MGSLPPKICLSTLPDRSTTSGRGRKHSVAGSPLAALTQLYTPAISNFWLCPYKRLHIGFLGCHVSYLRTYFENKISINNAAVTVNGNSVTVKTGTSALSAIDTGTTLIGGPSDDVATIWAAVPNSAASDSEGFYTFRTFIFLLFSLPKAYFFGGCRIACSSQVSISMAFGGKSWSINTADMNLGVERTGSSRCVGSIFDLNLGSNIPSGGDHPDWVVGDTFLVCDFIVILVGKLDLIWQSIF